MNTLGIRAYLQQLQHCKLDMFLLLKRHLQNPLATKLLEGAIVDGDMIRVTADGKGLVINGKTVHAVAAE